MAPLPQDPQVGHSLWLQRRSTRRAVRRVQWRSDWTPVGLVLLLLGLLVLLSVFPSKALSTLLAVPCPSTRQSACPLSNRQIGEEEPMIS